MGSHLDEASKGVKFTEAEREMVVARAWGLGKRGVLTVRDESMPDPSCGPRRARRESDRYRAERLEPRGGAIAR